MKKHFWTIFLALIAICASAQDLYVGSFYVTSIEEEAEYGDGGDKWINRRTHICDMFNFEQPDIVGLQGANETQISYINQKMPYYTVAADILYKNTIVLDTCGVVVDMPEGSTCTWAKFSKDDKVFYVFNICFAQAAATASSTRVRNAVTEINTENLPCLVVGNLGVNEEKQAYTRMAGKFHDCYTQAPIVSAEYGTVNNFDLANNHTSSRYDFIFVSKTVSVKAYGQLQYAYFTSTNGTNTRRLPSTHFPVMAKVTLPK